MTALDRGSAASVVGVRITATITDPGRRFVARGSGDQRRTTRVRLVCQIDKEPRGFGRFVARLRWREAVESLAPAPPAVGGPHVACVHFLERVATRLDRGPHVPFADTDSRTTILGFPASTSRRFYGPPDAPGASTGSAIRVELSSERPLRDR